MCTYVLGIYSIKLNGDIYEVVITRDTINVGSVNFNSNTSFANNQGRHRFA